MDELLRSSKCKRCGSPFKGAISWNTKLNHPSKVEYECGNILDVAENNWSPYSTNLCLQNQIDQLKKEESNAQD